ncbi:hypothetical protein VTN00DRAFT_5303 [Thermoascus crustaceus]|uniref:uncharacterized protein n=1 Tax=Thermoascus crustaceus TaxID=5088 RepID=UPI003743C37A
MRHTEILVHVSAPSGARDDARYRAQVEAILGFEPVSRQNVFGFQDVIDVESASGEASTASDRVAADATAGAVTPDRESSALHREPHPRLSELREVSPQPGPYTRARSALSDSELGPKDPVPSVSTHRRSQSDSLATPLSVIPDSQLEAPVPKADSLRYLEKEPLENVQVVRSFYPEEAPSPTKRRRLNPSSSPKGNSEANECVPSSVPDPEERPAGEKEVDTPKERSSTRVFKPTGSTASSSTRPSEPAQSRSISLSSLPLEIHPPPPPVSTEKFKSHITPTLHMLAERLKLSRTYRPVRQTRDLHPLERGFWLLLINVLVSETDRDEDAERGRGMRRMQRGASASKCQQNQADARNNWTLPFFTRFWSFLSDFIAKEGRAGWGVWCILEEAESSRTTASSANHSNENPNRMKSLTLKVYAWGEIAAHVYLLLFLASERRIRGMQAQWKDGAEETVIEMP